MCLGKHMFTDIIFSAWVEGMAAAGGGDLPDAVTAGLYAALNLSYRNLATKICFWIGQFLDHKIQMHEKKDECCKIFNGQSHNLAC